MWQDSKCRAPGWLHDYQVAYTFPKGVVEVCNKCRKLMFFPYETPNDIYLKHHQRSTLQPSDKRFKHEYRK